MSDKNEKAVCVAIYAPMIGGLYYSELITQIIQLCEIKRYTVKLIRTGDYGLYCSNFGLADTDIIILLRNSVHVDWVKSAKELGKAVVSISYDYFPLDVPVVVSDHAQGIKLAVDDLRSSGCSKLLFIGNLANYDIRKRYEYFCEYLEAENLALTEDSLIPVDEDLLGGGYKAAAELIRRQPDADGLVFGTTMNAIGFCRYLEDVDSEQLKRLSIIGFDAHSMVPVLQPNITSVDQNFSLMAYKAVSLGEGALQGNTIEQRHAIEPKLIAKGSEIYDNADAYMATSSELPELYDPNYMKCVTYNMHEWTESIAKSQLDDIMILRPLFRGYLEMVTFGRFVNAGFGKKYFKTLKTITPEEVLKHTPLDKNSLCKEESFPNDIPHLMCSRFQKSVSFVINKDGEHWGVLSVFGFESKGGAKSSLLSLVMYLEWILVHLKPKSSSKVPHVTNKSSNDSHDEKEQVIRGAISWNREANEYLWDHNALAILGFESDLDRGIYANMEISDRILPSDLTTLREYIESENRDNTHIVISYRHKDRSHRACEVTSKVLTELNTVEFSITPM